MRISRTSICCLIVLLLGSQLASAQSVIARWDEVVEDINGEPEQIGGYHIYYGNTPGGPYDQGFSTGNQTQTSVDNLVNGLTYYFVVTAIDTLGMESLYSNQVSYSVPYEDCNNLMDDDHDGLIDCQDLECPPVDEACDGFDNNCNGSIDEGCPCSEGDTRACSTDVGECELGTQRCDGNGEWGPCDGVFPAAELCDGLDNDCDEQIDNNLDAPLCELQQGVCQGSTQACGGISGWLACEYGINFEQEETRCDERDNDCDGQVDENGVCDDDQDPPDPSQVVVEGGLSCGKQPASRVWTWLLVLVLGILVNRLKLSIKR